MSISLVKPAVGSTDWGTEVNNNFTLIEDALNGGGAKAWVNFDGTGAVTIRDSFNVDSITDNGTGDYSINFATDFANNDYAVGHMVNEFVLGNRSDGINIRGTDDSLMSAGSLRIDVGSVSSGGAADLTVITVVVFGDQA